MPNLLTSGALNVVSNPLLTSVSADNLTVGGGVSINSNPSLTSVSFPLLDLDASELTGIAFNYNPLLETINFPSITIANNVYINGNDALTSILFPLFSASDNDFTVISSNLLLTLDLPSFISAFQMRIIGNAALTSLTFNSAITCISFDLSGNAFTEATVDYILATLDVAGQSNGALDLTGGTNSAPSGAGLASKANLIGKGWSVTNN